MSHPSIVYFMAGWSSQRQRNGDRGINVRAGCIEIIPLPSFLGLSLTWPAMQHTVDGCHQQCQPGERCGVSPPSAIRPQVSFRFAFWQSTMKSDRTQRDRQNCRHAGLGGLTPLRSPGHRQFCSVLMNSWRSGRLSTPPRSSLRPRSGWGSSWRHEVNGHFF